MLVSVIVVTCKVHNYLASCLDAVRGQTWPKTELIVIDNSLQNLFYTGALNKGIGMSTGDFVLCLNDDAILDKGFIREAMRGFEIDEKIGMVSGKILRLDKTTIDSTGLFLTLFRTARERGYGERDRGQFEREGEVFGVSGAVAFYRRRMLEELRGNRDYFDPDFGMFFEDLDLAWRARNRGWKGYYIPRAIAYHVRGASARRDSGAGRKFARRYINDALHRDLIKNRYLCVIKNESLPGFILHLPFILVYDIILWSFMLFFRRPAVRTFFSQPVPYSSAFKKRLFIL